MSIDLAPINLQLIAIFSAAAFIPQVGFRLLIFKGLHLYPIQSSRRFMVGTFSISLLIGLMGLGFLEARYLPTWQGVVPLVAAFAPHTYNLILWPALTLLILGPRFGWHKLIPSLMFVYGLDELLWNVIPWAMFGSSTGNFNPGAQMYYTTGPYWREFMVVMVAITILGYYVVRPRIRFNATWIVLALYALVWAAFGLPTGATDLVSTVFELGWQFAFWLFIWRTVRRS